MSVDVSDRLTTTLSCAESAPGLAARDRAPIRTPGSIQPHGALLTLREADTPILQASANAAALLGCSGPIVGARLQDVLGAEQERAIAAVLAELPRDHLPCLIGAVRPGLGLTGAAADAPAMLHVLAHYHQRVLVLEFERGRPDRPHAGLGAGSSDLSPLVRGFVSRLEQPTDVPALAALIAREVRQLTGFDRVMVYRFDAAWHGHVIAEDRAPDAASYFDLWFPASDIPAPARELHHLIRIQAVPDTAYAPVPIEPAVNPVAGAPLDLAYATLRSVSPAYLDYLRTMGVAASMSVSIIVEGRLWGLIVCHHRQPHRIAFELRSACDLLAQVFAIQLGARERTREYEHRAELKSIQTRLLASMAEEPNFVDGLRRHPDDLLRFASADGVAVLMDETCTRIGRTPEEPVIQALVDWLITEGREDVFATEALATVWPAGAAVREDASGVLALPLSKLHRSYILWFRAEAIHTMHWSSDPHLPTEPAPAHPRRIPPRHSVESWQETVRGRSIPWQPAELEIARELRTAIVGIVLRKAEELAQLSADLTRINRELEAFSYTVSHDLRAPFRHIAGFAELLRERLGADADAETRRYVDTITESARYAGTLVDNLLAFSRIGRTALRAISIATGQLVREVRDDLAGEFAGRDVEWRIGPLPEVRADPLLLRLAWQNLLANAIKYTRGRPHAVIEIWADIGPDETVFAVRDNGVGFDMRYVDKLFGVFQRLHRAEEFEGTGIGLATVRRIVARHGGRTWAEGALDRGATFYFALPTSSPTTSPTTAETP